MKCKCGGQFTWIPEGLMCRKCQRFIINMEFMMLKIRARAAWAEIGGSNE